MQSLFYSVGEMSEILGITERSVYRSARLIPGHVKIGGRVYFRKETFLRMTQGSEPLKEGLAVSDRHGLT